MEIEPILVLTTGGTIDKQYFDALSQYQIGETVVTDLLTRARITRPYLVEEVIRKDSLDLAEEDRQQIVSRVRQAGTSKVVITHGTDTMTVTAAALTGIMNKTIVLTGALSPARFSESDAPFNLGMAFAAVQVAPPGVYLAINGFIFRSGEAVKDHDQGRFIPL